DINANELAEVFSLSTTHLQRLFKFAFNQTIGCYIRSRRLAASLDELLKTDNKILDIALDYGFDYEQSYIRAFKSEFGMTPGEFRKSGQIIKVKPPLLLFDENRINDGVFFGPEIVMVPQFHIAGRSHIIPFADSFTMAPQAGIHFWQNDRNQIMNTVNPNVYIGLTCNINYEAGHSEYITSVQVRDIKNIPHGYRKYTFENSLCARFRYIGQHHYLDLSKHTAEAMYNAIWQFANDEQAKYALLNNKIYFEKIDTDLYDGTYCQMEWYTPVIEK
ncbi:MAG: helix-turn-helix domain-containing protein, partial [Bacteroidales bacterium]|nr:helix-turn-helix domain-containing protein [Bacteroidales bacterium]